jgi:hypothetical protein
VSLTVTAAPDDVTGSVRLVVDGGTAPYVVDASPGGDRPDYRVRTTWSTVSGVPTARVGVDGDLPLNTPTVYVATDSLGAQAQTPAVSVHSSVPLLSDATDPGRVLPVVVVSQKPNGWEARSVWWDILGSREPFVSIAPMRLRSGPLVLRTEDRAHRAAMLTLLAPGNPLVLRAPCGDAVDDLVLLVETVDESLVLDDAPAGATLWTLDYQAVSRDLGPYSVDPSRSYAAVVAAFPTYGDVLFTYPDYDALRAGDPAAGLGPELVVGGDFSSGLTGWSVFYTQTGIGWDSNAQTARATMADPGPAAAYLSQWNGGNPRTVTPGQRFRVAGRVRSSLPSTVVKVESLSNAAPGAPDYFDPGVAIAAVPITAGPAWSTFAADVVIPVGHDVWAVYWRADNMLAGAVVEFDDLTVRERV